jgi:hypothetical protein
MTQSGLYLGELRRSVGWRLKQLSNRSPIASMTYARLALAFDRERDDPPIVVFQMGRVGSRTIEESLAAALPDERIRHVHYLSQEGQEAFNAAYRNSPHFRHRGCGYVINNRHLADLIRRTLTVAPWRVVTAVRDPIARNVSMFFTMLPVKWPQLAAKDRMLSGDIEGLVDDLYPLFHREFDHETPLTWIDNELNAVMGIDVFETPFDPAKGYKIFRSDNRSVLLIRTESMNEVGSRALGEFLGLPDVPLKITNVAANKDYAALYKSFITRLVFTEEYIDRMYTSKLARHFYTSEELESFRVSWSKAAGEDLAA